jgi:DNA-binding GntR family transcriptional regulator
VHLARLESPSSDVAMLSSLRDHDCILEAIRRRDPEGCASMMSSHVQQATVRLRPSAVVPENENP